MIHSVTLILRTDDYQRAKAFYTDVLGFTCVNEAGDPVTGFGIFVRDKARIFVEAWIGAEDKIDRSRAYFHVTDFDALLAEFAAAGVPLAKDPHLTEYNMREFEIADPDGNIIAFGADP